MTHAYVTFWILYNWLISAWFLIWRFLANAHQRQIKDRIKICLHKDDFILTAPDAKINTGKILFWKKRQLKYTPN